LQCIRSINEAALRNCADGQPQLLDQPILQSLVCPVISTALDHLPSRCETRVNKRGLCRPSNGRLFKTRLGQRAGYLPIPLPRPAMPQPG
jgi:hypothetical protein